MPYLFTSDILLRILDLTPSIKTKLIMIEMIGHRLVDPKEKMDVLVDMFRFAEEKEKVSDILKARVHILNGLMFNRGVRAVMKGRGHHAVPVRAKTFSDVVSSASPDVRFTFSRSLARSSNITSTALEKLDEEDS
jgi:Domain of unknown function (DUF4476)